MESTLTLIDLAGTIALLLWGVHMVRSGIQRAFGPGLRRALGGALGNRLKAFITGLGVTAVLQSSTATGLMVAAFAASGVLDLVPALAVMLGANVGTTLIVQLLSFDISRASPLLVLIGVLMFNRGGAARTRDLGRVAIGLGLMLLALSRLLSIITPFEDVPSLRLLIGAAATQPIISLLFGAMASWAAHSSIAVVLLIMSFTAKGVIPLIAAIALVLGANIGSALNPVLETPSGGDRTGKQVAIGNLLNRLAGAAIVLPLVTMIAPHLFSIEPNLARSVANFHTLFNLGLACLFLPLLGPFARLLKMWMPPRFEPHDPAKPLYLDVSAQETPVIALGCATREALRMTDVLSEMLQGGMAGLDQGDRRLISETRRMGDVLDKLHTAIKNYLTGIDAESLTEEDDQRLNSILAFAANLDHAGDRLDRSAMSLAAKQLKRGVFLSVEERGEIRAAIERLNANLRSAATVFMTQDIREARILADEKTAFRDIEAKSIESHFRRLRSDKAANSETGSFYLDLLRDLKSVNDRLVAGAAYPVLEGRGELHPSRLREPPDSAFFEKESKQE